MNINFSDPIVLVCLGIILLCSILFVLAFKKFVGLFGRHPSQDPLASNFDSAALEAPEDVPPIELEPEERPAPPVVERPAPPPKPPETAHAAAQAPALAGKEVADRLEAMTQRLNEMQSVLNRQLQTPAAGSAPGAVPAGAIGQGFSPETIDKLLKIIGNVIQQVEILQKGLNLPSRPSVNAAAASSVPSGGPASTPVTPAVAPVAPKPAPMSTGASAPMPPLKP